MTMMPISSLFTNDITISDKKGVSQSLIKLSFKSQSHEGFFSPSQEEIASLLDTSFVYQDFEREGQ